jgi:hypothetical protein
MRIGIGIGIAKIIAAGGVSSVTISDPAADSIIIINMPYEVSGTAEGSGAIYATFDGGASRGTGTAGGGTFTLDVTAVTADIGATELQIRRTSDDVVIGTLACTVVQAALWAPANDVLGTVGTTAAAVPRNVYTSWNKTNTTIGQSLSDPESGSTAYSVSESTDGSPSNHFAEGPFSNAADAWVDEEVWLQPQGREWARIDYSGSGYGYVNLTTGAIGSTTAGITIALAETVGTWRRFSIEYRAIPASSRVRVWSCTGNLGHNYQGDGREAFRIWLPDDATGGLAQIRLQTATDKSGTGANLSNGTAATQRLYQASFKTLGGVTVAYREAGRASTTSSDDATLVAVASGDDPVFAVTGIWGGTGDDAAPCAWTGAGSIADVPLYIDGAELKSRRHDGSTEDIQTYGSGLAASVAAGVSWAVVGGAGRTRKLYIGGVLQDTITHADLSSATMTAFSDGLPGTTQDEFWGDILALAGTYTYAQLQAAAQRMAGVYGETA